MGNPWNNVPLEIYEAHMSLSGVAQLQALNRIMGKQIETYPDAESLAIVGIAGGNGLEHCEKRLRLVYGIDVNPAYLEVCAQRFGSAMGGRLRLMEMDLTNPESVLPKVDLIIADLLIEYVGVRTFCEKAAAARARYLSCVIQGSDCDLGFVSDSPYQAELTGIGKLHRDVDETELAAEMARHGYSVSYRESYRMPNGKRLVRLDFVAESKGKENTDNYTK